MTKSSKKEVQTALKNVHNTTMIAKRFSHFLSNKENIDHENIDDYLKIFKDLYSGKHCYSSLTEELLTDMALVGLDSDHAKEILGE